MTLKCNCLKTTSDFCGSRVQEHCRWVLRLSIAPRLQSRSLPGPQSLLAGQGDFASKLTNVFVGWLLSSVSCWPENHSSSPAAVWLPCSLLHEPLHGATHSMAASFSMRWKESHASKDWQDGIHDVLVT